jgi:hypothetical protein
VTPLQEPSLMDHSTKTGHMVTAENWVAAQEWISLFGAEGFHRSFKNYIKWYRCSL